MDWITALKFAISLFSKIMNLWLEKNAEKSQAKKEALNVALEGLDKRDPSLVNLGLSRFKRLR